MDNRNNHNSPGEGSSRQHGTNPQSPSWGSRALQAIPYRAKAEPRLAAYVSDDLDELVTPTTNTHQHYTSNAGKLKEDPPRLLHTSLGHDNIDNQLQDIYIAVMGVTGAGKSQFIQLCSGLSSVVVGHSMKSCTIEVEEHSFVLGNRRIHLIDTPGFNDHERSDREVLEEIAMWFGTAYRDHIPLAGILYVHRITDPRMDGSALSNLRMFKKLCGEDFYPRVSLATTFWDIVPETTGLSREQELLNSDEFWGYMVKRGSKTYRHHGGEEGKWSAMRILASIVQEPEDEREKKAPSYVRVQREMGEENMSLDETSAGQEVNAKLLQERKKFEKRLEQAKRDMHEALQEKDREAAEAFRRQKESIEKQLENTQEESKKLHVKLEDMQLKYVEQMEEYKKAVDAQQRLINDLEARNRTKDAKLRRLQPDSNDALVLRSEIQQNNDKIEEAKNQVGEQSRKLNRIQGYVSQAAAWLKKHPEVMAKASKAALNLFNIAAVVVGRAYILSRQRRMFNPEFSSYVVEEVDTDSQTFTTAPSSSGRSLSSSK